MEDLAEGNGMGGNPQLDAKHALVADTPDTEQQSCRMAGGFTF